MEFKSFSEKQLRLLTWWCHGSSDSAYDGIICDGAVRSGKTLCMSISFISWAMGMFNDTSFAICGKSIASLKRNVIAPLLPILRDLGFACTEKSSQNLLKIAFGGNTNTFYYFGGKDKSSASLIQGLTLGGLPFVSSVLMQILYATGSNWERVGNLRYAVTYRPTNDLSDKAFAADRAMQIAKGWQEAMKSGSEIKDFIAVGDVDIKVIGADSQILDSSTPVRQLLEQIVAKLGLPPFLLGLSWSTTERMAQQQCDILIGELYRYRRLLTPVIKKIAQTYLRMQGLSPDCHVEWSNISLLDTSQQAKTEYYLALAKKNTAQANAIGKGDL